MMWLFLVLALGGCSAAQTVKAVGEVAVAVAGISALTTDERAPFAICDSMEREAKAAASACWQEIARKCVKDEDSGRKTGECPRCDELDALEQALKKAGCLDLPAIG